MKFYWGRKVKVFADYSCEVRWYDKCPRCDNSNLAVTMVFSVDMELDYAETCVRCNFFFMCLLTAGWKNYICAVCTMSPLAFVYLDIDRISLHFLFLLTFGQ